MHKYLSLYKLCTEIIIDSLALLSYLNRERQMLKVTFIDYQGTERTIEANVNDTVMETATRNGVPGIDADCGGACACATCHVYINSSWTDVVGGAEELEKEMLEVAEGVEDNSRLACQVKLTHAMDGLVVTTPESQF